jgi:hypothetical protein
MQVGEIIRGADPFFIIGVGKIYLLKKLEFTDRLKTPVSVICYDVWCGRLKTGKQVFDTLTIDKRGCRLKFRDIRAG